ncbi:MAG: hypothetical protein ACTSQY_00630, partial [Candidatus Odinarchaeia archaeon]
ESAYTHATGNGSDHSDVALNTTHRTSNGSDHSFIDQDVTSGSAPTFLATNLADGGTNAIITLTQETNFETAYTHSQGDGSDHADVATNSAHVAANSGVHGITGSVVGTSDSQELTNKKIGTGTSDHSVTGASDLFITGKLEVDSTGYFDSGLQTASSTYSTFNGSLKVTDTRNVYGLVLNDNVKLHFGTNGSARGRLYYNTVQNPNTLTLGVPTGSMGLVVCKSGDELSYNYTHALQTNPTLFVHSANQATDEWISLTHDQTDGKIESGKGTIKFVSVTDSTVTLTQLKSAYTHISNDGSDHSFINQNVTTTGTPQFAQMFIDDANTYIDKDGSNNMTFTDAVTGTKTLAELATSTSSFTLTADSGSDQTISSGDTLTIEGGTGIDTVVGATDKVTVSIDSTVVTLTDSQTLTNKTFSNAGFKMVDSSGGQEYTIVPGDIDSNYSLVLPPITGTDTILSANADQDVQDKTFTANCTFKDSALFINESGDAGNTYQLIPSTLTANRTITLPALAANDVFVFEAQTQTLTNKTLTTPTIGDFTNATHDHSNAANGDALAASAVTAHEGSIDHNNLLNAHNLTTDIDHDSLTNFVTDEHVAHSGITLTAGTGLSGGGDISANRTFSLSHLGIESLTDPNDDRILFWDDGAGATAWLDLGDFLEISGTTFNCTALDQWMIIANYPEFLSENFTETLGGTGSSDVANGEAILSASGGASNDVTEEQDSHITPTAGEIWNIYFDDLEVNYSDGELATASDTLVFGLRDNNNVTEQIIFIKQTGNSNDKIGTRTRTGANITDNADAGTLTRATKYNCRIRINGTSEVKFYINDTVIQTHTTNITTNELGILMSIKRSASESSAGNLKVSRIRIKKGD